jgi:sugar phosphate isomerase/epimerase
MTRREMMVNSARAIAGLALTTSCRSLGPSLGGRGFKIGVCDWTIGKRTDPASLEMAKRLGLDGVQVDFGSGQDDLPLCNPELQKKFLEAVNKHDVQVASLALGTLNNVVLMAFFGKGDLRNDKKGTDVVVERLKKVAPKAEKAGVFLGFESWLSAEQHLDIIERVGSPAVKVYYDVANSHKAGYDIYEEIRLLGKQICEFHAKDYDDLYGKGTIAFEEVRRAMDDIGYRGWIVMEGVKMPLGLEESMRYDAKYLRGVFPPRV